MLEFFFLKDLVINYRMKSNFVVTKFMAKRFLRVQREPHPDGGGKVEKDHPQEGMPVIL